MNDEKTDILLVEDNAEDAHLAIRALRKTGVSNSILHISDGEEALQFLFCRAGHQDGKSADLPKLILLDLKMPKLDGLEILKKIKTDERTKAVPVVMLSSSNQNFDIQRCLYYGANSYVVKPVDFERFVQAVATVGNYWMNVNQSIQQEDI